MTLSPPDFKTDDLFNLEDKWIQTDTSELTHFFESGDGEPMLFLHGSGIGVSAASTWWLNLPELSNSLRTIAFDFIGYGETICAPDVTYGIKEWGAHTLRVMDALNIDKAWLNGSSLGGWVALQLAIDYPERVLGVISIGTGGHKRDEAKAYQPSPEISKEFIRQGLEKKITDNSIVCETLIKVRYDAALKDDLAGRRPALLDARDRDRDALALDLEALAQLPVPVLLVHGMNDKVVPLSRTIELLTATPSADAHIFSGCGHWPHIGKADEFNRVVMNYIISRNDPQSQ